MGERTLRRWRNRKGRVRWRRRSPFGVPISRRPLVRRRDRHLGSKLRRNRYPRCLRETVVFPGLVESVLEKSAGTFAIVCRSKNRRKRGKIFCSRREEKFQYFPFMMNNLKEVL